MGSIVTSSFDEQVSSGDIDEDLNDLEIQHTLGSLAISQTRAPKVRGEPFTFFKLNS